MACRVHFVWVTLCIIAKVCLHFVVFGASVTNMWLKLSPTFLVNTSWVISCWSYIFKSNLKFTFSMVLEIWKKQTFCIGSHHFCCFFNSEIVTETNYLTQIAFYLIYNDIIYHHFHENPHFQTALHYWTLSFKNWSRKSYEQFENIVKIPTCCSSL